MVRVRAVTHVNPRLRKEVRTVQQDMVDVLMTRAIRSVSRVRVGSKYVSVVNPSIGISQVQLAAHVQSIGPEPGIPRGGEFVRKCERLVEVTTNQGEGSSVQKRIQASGMVHEGSRREVFDGLCDIVKEARSVRGYRWSIEVDHSEPDTTGAGTSDSHICDHNPPSGLSKGW